MSLLKLQSCRLLNYSYTWLNSVCMYGCRMEHVLGVLVCKCAALLANSPLCFRVYRHRDPVTLELLDEEEAAEQHALEVLLDEDAREVRRDT